MGHGTRGEALTGDGDAEILEDGGVRLFGVELVREAGQRELLFDGALGVMVAAQEDDAAARLAEPGDLGHEKEARVEIPPVAVEEIASEQEELRAAVEAQLDQAGKRRARGLGDGLVGRAVVTGQAAERAVEMQVGGVNDENGHDAAGVLAASTVMGLYLVTGGGGFIGSSIVEELLAAGERVRVLDDFSTGRRENLASVAGKVELFEGRLQDVALTARALEGVEVVFHEGAIPSVARSVESPLESLDANVMGTTALVESARRAGVRRIVFAASSAAYGQTKELPKIETMAPEPLSPYAVAKLAAEHLLRITAQLYGVDTVSLRYFNVFGPKQDPTSQYAAVVPNFITAALEGKRPQIYGDGEQTRDFCYVDNVVRANLLAAASKEPLRGEVMNVACGERISLNQLVAMVGEEAGQKLEPEYHETRAGDVRDSLADIEKAKRLIGYEPIVRVREGIARTFAAFAGRRAT